MAITARPYLVTYKAEHLLMLTHRDGEYEESIKSAIQKEYGIAWTAMLEYEVIGCAGMLFTGTGIGSLWACFSPKIADHSFWIHRICKNYIRDLKRAYKLRRVEFVAIGDIARNNDWALALGFCREENGVARKFTAKGQDVVRYEWIDDD